MITKEINFFLDFLLGRPKILSKNKVSLIEESENSPNIFHFDKETIKIDEENKNDIKDEKEEIFPEKAVFQHKIPENIEELSAEHNIDTSEEPVMTRNRAVSKRNNSNIIEEKPNNEDISDKNTRIRGRTYQSPTPRKKESLKKQFSENFDENNNILIKVRNSENTFNFTLLNYIFSFINQSQLNLVLAGYFEKVIISLLNLRDIYVYLHNLMKYFL